MSITRRLQTGAALDVRSQRTREALMAALLVLLQEQSFEQVTIRGITMRAHIGYATYFRHFSSKEALLGEIASAEIAALLAMTTPLLAAANSAKSSLALCRWIAERRALWSVLLTGGAADPVRREFIRQARELPASSAAPAAWLPADLAVVHGAGGTIDLLAWWLTQEKGFSVERIAAILDRLIVTPLLDAGTERS